MLAHQRGQHGERIPLRALELLTQLLYIDRQPAALKLLLAVLLVGVLMWLITAPRRHGALLCLAAAALALVLPFCIHNFRPVEGLWRYLYLPAAPAMMMAALAAGLQPGAGRRAVGRILVALTAGAWLWQSHVFFWQGGS